jgi:hypothetical protein
VFIAILLPTGHARGGEADVLEAKVRCNQASVCQFAVTVRHADEGWDHYADRWEVLSEDGKVLATRILRHPHVDEQPFTRLLPGVAIASEISRVRIRARDSMHGYGGAEIVVDIPAPPEPEG